MAVAPTLEVPVVVDVTTFKNTGKDYAVQFNLGPLETFIRVGMRRLDRRQRCAHCGNRRICFVVGVGELLASPPSCAKCAGLRR